MVKHTPRLILPSNGRAHGWKPDTPDVFAPPLSRKIDTALTATIRNPSLNKEWYAPIGDQGDLGSCTGWGTRAAMYLKFKEKHGEKISGKWGEEWDLSPLAIYWLGRRRENCIPYDEGCEIKDVVEEAAKFGAPTEATWPYEISKFTREPSVKAFKEGLWHQAVGSYRCDERGAPTEQTLNNMLLALQNGFPIVLGFTCYSNLWEADGNGVVPSPKGRVEGGHCITIYGADTDSRYFWGPNSWSNEWGGTPPGGGERGYIYLPFAGVENGWIDDCHAVDIE